MAQSRQSGAGGSFIGDPRWFPMDLDQQTGAIRFADIGPERPGGRDFLDIVRGERVVPQKTLPAAEALKIVRDDPERPRINFIWHTSYCCSTAIASAIDVPGRNTSLLEPTLLLRVALLRREADRQRRDISWLSDVAYRLLNRPYQKGAAVTIKAAPTSNYLVADAAAKTNGKMLFLYCDCKSFLRATMRYGENRRSTVRYLFNVLYRDEGAVTRWNPESIAKLTDLEIAGLTWQLLISRFEASLKIYGDRAASLDCDAFLEDPQGVLARIWDFLELPGDVEESSLYWDDVFLNRHAKYAGKSFTPEARLQAGKYLNAELAAEIDKTADAVLSQFSQGRDILPLPRALATKAVTR
ncbi:MAG TPA: hypothetical protein VGM17_00710 [Rhizomicrobium sp.]|jgi:hypothetical protein